VSDWGTRQLLAVSQDGKKEVMVTLDVPSFQPICMDWLPDGRLLIVSSADGRLLCRQADGSLTTYAQLSQLSGTGWNEIVVDGRGNAYVNGDVLALVTPDGTVRQVANTFAFPNGMAITPDNTTLILAESHTRHLTAFDIAADGSLSGRRVWANPGDGVPDGICLDAQGAVWYADVPNKRCVRVREGGQVLQTIRSTEDASPVCLVATIARRCFWSHGSGTAWRRRLMQRRWARFSPLKHRHQGSAGPSSFTGRNSNLCHFVRTSLSRKAAIPKRWATQKIWHKKREPMIGSLVTNIIKYTLFPAKSQVFHAPWLPPQVPRRWLR
jgi:hypothetical protein